MTVRFASVAAPLAIVLAALSLAACGHNTEQRAATGAATGAVIAGPVGAVIGGAAGVVADRAARQ